MEKRLDLSVKSNAERSKNATALIGFTIMNAILTGAYFAEVLKSVRTFGSYAVILFLCVIPTAASIMLYFKKKDSLLIRYVSTTGFLLLYIYVMLTTTTDLVFSYIIVFFLIVIIYSDMRLSWGVALVALGINVVYVVRRLLEGALHETAMTNAEIMLACITLSFTFAILSVKKINQINAANFSKAEQDREQAEGLLEAVLKVSSTITENISGAVTESTQLKDSIEMTQKSMENLAAGTNDTIKAIMEQKDSTEQIDVHIHEVESAVNLIRAEIHNAENNLELGNDVMQDLLQQVKISETSGELAAEKMAELSEYAKKMQDILGLISSVANQTGMLALNASIEAARAGEAGRGFAVVASQISNLASQTNSATSDINQLISHITQSIDDVNGAMSNLLESSGLQNKYVDDTADNFRKIRGNTDEIAAQAEQLERVVDVVMTANTQVIEKIENVSALTQEVTASVNETVESSTVNLESVEKMASLMDKLGEEADKLQSTYTAN